MGDMGYNKQLPALPAMALFIASLFLGGIMQSDQIGDQLMHVTGAYAVGGGGERCAD